jgi:hypothetical protein
MGLMPTDLGSGVFLENSRVPHTSPAFWNSLYSGLLCDPIPMAHREVHGPAGIDRKDFPRDCGDKHEWLKVSSCPALAGGAAS